MIKQGCKHEFGKPIAIAGLSNRAFKLEEKCNLCGHTRQFYRCANSVEDLKEWDLSQLKPCTPTTKKEKIKFFKDRKNYFEKQIKKDSSEIVKLNKQIKDLEKRNEWRTKSNNKF